tara:strand:- start:237 stop:464 length:228 start_codon:yes stop_codon:yes gene_type:complete
MTLRSKQYDRNKIKTVKLTEAEIRTVSDALDNYEADLQHTDTGWEYSGLSKAEIKRFYVVREKLVGTPSPNGEQT